MCVAHALDVFATGMVAGAFGLGTFALHPAAERLHQSAHVRLRQELIRRASSYLPPFMLLPVPAAIAALVSCRMSVAPPFDILGCVFSLTTIAITVAVNAPLNRRFATWSADALAPDWQRHVEHWNVAHVARMCTAWAAFVCAILAWR